jgi:hypothetical protein
MIKKEAPIALSDANWIATILLSPNAFETNGL